MLERPSGEGGPDFETIQVGKIALHFERDFRLMLSLGHALVQGDGKTIQAAQNRAQNAAPVPHLPDLAGALILAAVFFFEAGWLRRRLSEHAGGSDQNAGDLSFSACNHDLVSLKDEAGAKVFDS